MSEKFLKPWFANCNVKFYCDDTEPKLYPDAYTQYIPLSAYDQLLQRIKELEGDVQVQKLEAARARSEEQFAYKVRDSYKEEIATLKKENERLRGLLAKADAFFANNPNEDVNGK